MDTVNIVEASWDMVRKLKRNNASFSLADREIANGHIATLEALAGAYRNLDRGKSVESVHILLDRADHSGLKGYTDATALKRAIQQELKSELLEARTSAPVRAIEGRAQYNADRKAKLAKEAEEAGKETGFLERHFGKRLAKGFARHEEWMKTKSPAGRMGFAVGEMVLGSVAMEVGSQMLSQSISGLKQSSLQQVDDKGGRTTVLVMAPIPAGERTFKAVVGAGAAAAGLVATGLGFYGIFRSHEI